MKIQYCSDLHLEFEQNSKYFINKPLNVCGDVLILAGDIIPLQFEFFNNSFFNFISDNYKQVFWVPGNHEFYYLDISKYNKSYNLQFRKNINIVNNVELIYRNTRFIFSTLWSEISNTNAKTIEQNVSDFINISNKNGKFKVADYNKLHNQSLNFIQETLKTKIQNTVVVTHHLPSALCNSSLNKNSNINEAYCVDLSNYIETCSANFWIYGHSHFNQKPVYIGNTILLTNQLGYIQHEPLNQFKHNAYFSV